MPLWADNLVYCIDGGTSKNIYAAEVIGTTYDKFGELETVHVAIGNTVKERQKELKAIEENHHGGNCYGADSVYRTREEAKREAFKRKLKG